MLVARHGIQADRIEGGANNVDPGQRNHDVNEFVPWPANTSLAGGPEARGRMLTWWNRNDQVSPVLRAAAVHADIPASTTPSWNLHGYRANLTANLSSPRTGESASYVGANPVFFLSEAELYITMSQTQASDRVLNHVAYDGTVVVVSLWWLRSAGANDYSVSGMTLGGGWGAGYPNQTGENLVFRPAVWVRRTPAVMSQPDPGLTLPLAANECLQDNPDGIRPSNIFVDETGFEWCVVTTEGNYSMLVARYTIQNDRIEGGAIHVAPGQRNHDVNEFIAWPANTSLAGGPEARGRMYTWWNRADQVSPNLRAQAVHADIPASTTPSWPIDYRSNLTTNLSSPRTGESAVGVGQNPVFFLTQAEITQRLGQIDDTYRITTRVAYDGTVGAAFGLRWSLRSAGQNTNSVAIVDPTGNWNTSSAANTDPGKAFRPAIWVRR